VNIKPCPTESTLRMSEISVEEHRNFYCQHYDQCLSHAIEQDWANWTCMRCPLFAEKGEGPSTRQYAFSRGKDSGWMGV
jgi:hypothetical protein